VDEIEGFSRDFLTPERYDKFLKVINQRYSDLTIVLENVFDPHNVAAVMRTADSVGIGDIYTIKTQIPRKNKFGKNSSASAKKWVNIHPFDEVKDCMEFLKNKGFRILTTHLSEQSQSIYETNFNRKVAIVFGNEKDGLSEEALTYSDGNIKIPLMGMTQSLNISVACAVTLYEVLRQRINAPTDNQQLTTDEKQALFTKWKDREFYRNKK
jgi:tRNA (guanosine-2'-O-)-methyltransferase